MEFFSIFEENGWLYSACYPEHQVDGESLDIFGMLFDRWTDSQFLLEFFKANASDLANPFWRGMTIDQAVKQVLKESERFEDLLWSIETKQPGFEGITFRDVFKHLHENIYSLSWDEEQFRKARPDMRDSMLRLYAIELEDGSFVITGGAIKLTEKMIGEQYNEEFKNLHRVKEYLTSQGIVDKLGLEAI
jgi:hypothetical protein